MFCLANVLRAQRKMCFARAIFRRLNFKSWSENVVFVRFDLKMGFAPKRGAIFHSVLNSYSRVDLLSSDFTSLLCFSTVHSVGS